VGLSFGPMPPLNWRKRDARGGGIKGAWRILRLALRVRQDPAPFCREVSSGVVRYLRSRLVELPGSRALDAGAGGGALAEALTEAGVQMVGLDVADLRGPQVGRTTFVIGRGERLPFRDGSYDLALSSNVLEHVPDPWALIGELQRVCRPGGHVWLSWTNWLSPLGGHEMTPFQYLGPRLAPRAYRAVWGRPPRWNVPGETLFVTHIGDVLQRLRSGPFEVLDVAPRYWPSLRIIARIPGLREVAMWNCMILLRRPAEVTAGPDAPSGASRGGNRPAS
jgi:SAM-dependent methyltransferase